MLEHLDESSGSRKRTPIFLGVATRENSRGGLPAAEAPDNQQERPIDPEWVTGFVDGEGCFSIGFVRQPDRRNRKGYRTGYQVNHDFVVVQGARSVHVQHGLREFFGVGRVYMNARHDNHRENMYLYTVHRRSDLLEVVIPFFREHPLRTSKAADFEKFVRCLELINAKAHLTRNGLIEIAKITETMNRQRPRTELIRILRDHTSDVRDSG